MLVSKNVFSVLRIMVLFFVCGVKDVYSCDLVDIEDLHKVFSHQCELKDMFFAPLNKIYPKLFGGQVDKGLSNLCTKSKEDYFAIDNNAGSLERVNVTPSLVTNPIEMKRSNMPSSSFFSQMLRKNKRENIFLSASQSQQDNKVSSVSDTLIKSPTMMNAAFSSIYIALPATIFFFLCRSLNAVSTL